MTRGLQKKALQSTKLSNGKYLRSELQSAFLFVTFFFRNEIKSDIFIDFT